MVRRSKSDQAIPAECAVDAQSHTVALSSFGMKLPGLRPLKHIHGDTEKMQPLNAYYDPTWYLEASR